MGNPLLLLIFCDEFRADALSCNGGPKGLTPNLDRLASEGQNFKRAYCSSPVCVPSRWSGLTGQSVNKTGVWHNEACWRNYKMEHPAPTVIEAFRSAGWKSINVGKIHLPEHNNPFDENFPEGGVQGELTQKMKSLGRTLEKSPKGAENLGGILPDDEEFPADRIADTVLEQIKTNSDKPLFIRASYLQPHTPVIPRKADFEKWFDPDQPEIQLNATTPSRFEALQSYNYGSSKMDPNTARRCWWAYHALVHWVDRQIGYLLNEIDALGRKDDLKIVFTADHGASLGEGGAWAKQSFKVASHQVPMVIWDGTTQNKVREDLSDSTDLPRTLCDLAGIPPLNTFDGRSLLSGEEPEAIISGIGYGLEWSHLMPNRRYGSWENNKGWPRRVCVRTREWRYDRNTRFEGQDIGPEHEEADPCLIHTQTDPKEETNVFSISCHHDIVTQLEKRLQEWLSNPQEPGVMPQPKT